MIIAGNSGSGKTELALYFIRQAPRFLIVDSNLEIAIRLKMPYTMDLKKWNIETPIFYPQQYTTQMLDAMLRKARQFKNLLLFIDDLDLFSGGQYYHGDEINRAMVNIRHQNIALILSMKRIVSIPYLIPQQANYVYLFSVNALDFDALEQWQLTLNYPGDLTDLTRMVTHTFAAFEPLDRTSRNATDPKRFVGFFKLPTEGLALKNPDNLI